MRGRDEPGEKPFEQAARIRAVEDERAIRAERFPIDRGSDAEHVRRCGGGFASREREPSILIGHRTRLADRGDLRRERGRCGPGRGIDHREGGIAHALGERTGIGGDRTECARDLVEQRLWS